MCSATAHLRTSGSAGAKLSRWSIGARATGGADTCVSQGSDLQLDQRRLFEPAPDPGIDAGGALGDVDRLVVLEPHRHVVAGHQDRARLLAPQVPDALHG